MWSLSRSDRRKKSSYSEVGEYFTYLRPLPGGMCQCFQPSWLQKQPLHKGRTHTSPSTAKYKVSPHQKKVLIKSHQFVRMLNAEQTACNFQFFPLLPVESSTLPPSIQGQEVQGRLAKRANLQQVQDMQITESGFLGENCK